MEVVPELGGVVVLVAIGAHAVGPLLDRTDHSRVLLEGDVGRVDVGAADFAGGVGLLGCAAGAAACFGEVFCFEGVGVVPVGRFASEGSDLRSALGATRTLNFLIRRLAVWR